MVQDPQAEVSQGGHAGSAAGTVVVQGDEARFRIAGGRDLPAHFHLFVGNLRRAGCCAGRSGDQGAEENEARHPSAREQLGIFKPAGDFQFHSRSRHGPRNGECGAGPVAAGDERSEPVHGLTLRAS